DFGQVQPPTPPKPAARPAVKPPPTAPKTRAPDAHQAWSVGDTPRALSRIESILRPFPVPSGEWNAYRSRLPLALDQPTRPHRHRRELRRQLCLRWIEASLARPRPEPSPGRRTLRSAAGPSPEQPASLL